ncbi:hypothetical protein LNQ81_09620 [Myroides sp. M-43]|uniref:hypothetical protein n=1 Tax=Myroides oncorhynchi TaxID=2893756 RepID=UPI001E3622DC|nr:hypothetical protein [Myroides oncorhynchi]MCC9042932.1 hypothetical protein [Myroides oncorhynchi]
MKKLVLGISIGILALIIGGCNGQKGSYTSSLDEEKEPGIPQESSVMYKAPLAQPLLDINNSISRLPDPIDGVSPLDFKYTSEIRAELCLFIQNLSLTQTNNRIVIVERINKSKVYKFGYYAAVLSENSPIYYLKIDDYRNSVLKAGSRLVDDPANVAKADIELFYKIAQTSDLEMYNINKELVARKEAVNSRVYLHIMDRAGRGFRVETYRLK